MRNRLNAPTKHILILDDVINNQARLLQHFNEIFEHEGEVQISAVPGGLYGMNLIENAVGYEFDLIILDHDMPDGDGDIFLKWLRIKNIDIPVITFSGIPSNNYHLMELGANYCFEKEAVIKGLADSIIFEILNINKI